MKIKSPQSDYSNILFATSASADQLGDADYDDLLNPEGSSSHSNSSINRHPGIWIMPGDESDDKAGLMICAETVEWNQPLERCYSHSNTEGWEKLTVGQW